MSTKHDAGPALLLTREATQVLPFTEVEGGDALRDAGVCISYIFNRVQAKD